MEAFDLLLVVFAYSLAALVKGAIGVGTPLVVVPLLSPQLGLPQTVATLVFPLIVANAWHVWEFREIRREMPFLTPFLVAAGLGVGVGTWGLVSLDSAPLMIVVGASVLAYLAFNLAVPGFRLVDRHAVVAAPFAGAGSGVLQGISGISAPISLTYLSAVGLERSGFIFSASATFLIFAIFQALALTVANVLTQTLALVSLLAAIPTAALMPLGGYLGRRIPPRAFRQIVLCMLFLLALRMIWQGLSALYN